MYNGRKSHTEFITNCSSFHSELNDSSADELMYTYDHMVRLRYDNTDWVIGGNLWYQSIAGLFLKSLEHATKPKSNYNQTGEKPAVFENGGKWSHI